MERTQCPSCGEELRELPYSIVGIMGQEREPYTQQAACPACRSMYERQYTPSPDPDRLDIVGRYVRKRRLSRREARSFRRWNA